MKYKLIIFDFDGTLADTLPFILTIIDDLADKYGIRRLDRDAIDQVRRLDAKTLLKQYKVPTWKLPMMARHLHRLIAANVHQIKLFDGVSEMLRQLAEAGVVLAIVSSNGRENVRKVLGPANLEYIRYLECGAAVYGKHARLKKVLKRAGVRPSEAIAIGDELRDNEAARRIHMDFGAVAWGYTYMEALQAGAPNESFYEVKDITRLATETAAAHPHPHAPQALKPGRTARLLHALRIRRKDDTA